MLIWELELFARVVVAGICGAAIGYERQNRLKEAGIRTHLIVALGAALMMVVSKYGFMVFRILSGRMVLRWTLRELRLRLSLVLDFWARGLFLSINSLSAG